MIENYQDFMRKINSKNVIYHFTHIMNLDLMIDDGYFLCRHNDLELNKSPYAISCTRKKNLKWGAIRLVLDYEKIREKYSVEPVNFFGKKIKKYNRQQDEERIYTNNPTFPIFKYLLRIDILSILKNDYLFNDVIKKIENKEIHYKIVDTF